MSFFGAFVSDFYRRFISRIEFSIVLLYLEWRKGIYYLLNDGMTVGDLLFLIESKSNKESEKISTLWKIRISILQGSLIARSSAENMIGMERGI